MQLAAAAVAAVIGAVASASAPVSLAAPPPPQKRLLLLSRSRGVRDGTDGLDAEQLADGPPQASEFRFLDNMEPVAPMDIVSSPSSVATLPGVGLLPMPGEHHNSLHIPPYRNPDPFPTALGHTCNCEIPRRTPVTEEQDDWARQVARQLGIRRSALPKPLSPEGRVKCECSGSGHSEWTRVEPVPKSRNFTLESADITFPAGNYWAPALNAGLVAPEDRMPIEHYPLLAPSDQIKTIPGTAQEDTVPRKYARYLDQVSAREQLCDGDGVSERCVTDCLPGDPVEAHLGSTNLNARIVSTHVGGSAVIEFTPTQVRDASATVDCPLQAGCTMFRVCRAPGEWCVRQHTEHPRDFLGNLHLRLICPTGTEICRSVQQLVMGKLLRKGGRACRPVAQEVEG